LAKTTWNLDSKRLLDIAQQVRSRAEFAYARSSFTTDPTYRYIVKSGMLKRGWISPKPLKKALAIKQSLDTSGRTEKYKRILRLCLLSEVVHHASNVKFGPEIYCAAKKKDAPVFEGFYERIEQVAADLDTLWVGLRRGLGRQQPAVNVGRIGLRSAQRDRGVTHRAAAASGGSRRALHNRSVAAFPIRSPPRQAWAAIAVAAVDSRRRVVAESRQNS
jgi:hypothetical protein